MCTHKSLVCLNPCSSIPSNLSMASTFASKPGLLLRVGFSHPRARGDEIRVLVFMLEWKCQDLGCRRELDKVSFVLIYNKENVIVVSKFWALWVMTYSVVFSKIKVQMSYCTLQCGSPLPRLLLRGASAQGVLAAKGRHGKHKARGAAFKQICREMEGWG